MLGEVRVGGRRLAGRPRKKWSECVMEGMNFVWSGIPCGARSDRRKWKAVIALLRGRYVSMKEKEEMGKYGR